VPALRIALFGTASRFSLLALQELAAHGLVAAVVLWQPTYNLLRASVLRIPGLRRMSSFERLARERSIPVVLATRSNQAAVTDRLRMARPDLICVAIYPRRISPELIDLAPLGAINVHPSLLPRHRGPLPLFWTYHADDRTAGVTVHYISQILDAGDIIMQEGFPLLRGYPSVKLDEDLAKRGALLLRSAAEALAHGQASRTGQDARAATYAPLVRPGIPMVRFGEWDVERVWHFLAALSPRYCEPLTDNRGHSALYRGVTGFERGHFATPGTIEAVDQGWKLHCRGGTVLLAKAA